MTIRPEEYVLEPLPDGGMLLNHVSGALLVLNSTAAFVWANVLDGMPIRQLVELFGRTFAVSDTVARADIAAALSPYTEQHVVPPPTETHYESLGEFYRFSVAGLPVLEIAASGRSLRVLRELTASELYFHLKAVSPKLVALTGHPVLHASAVRSGEEPVTAFLGLSGAGKTTTARAFAAAGFQLICEDKLVLRKRGDDWVAVLTGEAQIDSWLRETSARLRAVPLGDWCEVDSLDEVVEGAVAKISTLVIVDRTRRTGTSIDLELIGPTLAASQVFQHAFYGSFAAAEWSRYARVAATLARSTSTYLARLPDGLDLLKDAARSYAEKMQS